MTGTICDALMAPTPGELTFAINRELVGQGTAVSDAEVAAAVAFAFRELKLVVEPGGAAALAALLSGKIDVSGKTVVVVLSGGNVDPELFARLVADQVNSAIRSSSVIALIAASGSLPAARDMVRPKPRAAAMDSPG